MTERKIDWNKCYRNFHYEIEWENGGSSFEDFDVNHIEFSHDFFTEFEAVLYAFNIMNEKGINQFNIMYCRVEETFDSEMRTNVLLWIGE